VSPFKDESYEMSSRLDYAEKSEEFDRPQSLEVTTTVKSY